jgi:hypothetical protein
MKKKQTGWPFQEGYVVRTDGETHAFTDYRWNDGSVTRRWMMNPKLINIETVMMRPFSLKAGRTPDQ